MGKRVILPESIISFPNLYEPTSFTDQDKKKYSATFVFPEGTDLRALKAAALEVGREAFGSKFDDAVKRGKLHWPFKDVDDEENEQRGYPAGSSFIRARSDKRPGVVSIYPDANGKPSEITDPDEVYAGCVVRASVDVYAFKGQANSGVTFGLGNVQKLRDGDRLDGQIAATSEFEADASAVADLSSLEDDDTATTKTRTSKSKASQVDAIDGDDLSDLIG